MEKTSNNPLPPDAGRWRCSLEPVTDPLQLEKDWRSLEATAEGPFFLSWDWIGCWLNSMPAGRSPDVLRVECAGRLVGLALLSDVDRRWLGVIPRRGFHLHETGDTALDSVTIEYNGLLAPPAFRDEATRRAIEWLLDASRSDELHLSGVSAATLQPFDQNRFSIRLRDKKSVYTVDLARIRSAGGNFMATLSTNTRAQLRRAIRQYENLGALRIVEAATAEEAEGMLTGMIPLHQAYWQKRGRDGSFANSTFLGFHRRLIGDSFGRGCIQFLRCDAGTAVIGYLYNFRKDGRIYAYQSGFDYDLLPRSKPGWVCHYLAIEENLRHRAAVYDLLAGHSQFKGSFAQSGEELVWAVVERSGWLPAMDRSLRVLKAALTKA